MTELNKITFKAIHPLVSIIWFIVLLVLFFLVAEIVQTVSYMSERTYLMISLTTIILIIGYIVLRKQVKKIEFIITEDKLEINEGKTEVQHSILIPFDMIKDYNVYYMLVKKMGYIIRIKADRNYLYYVDWISLSRNKKFDIITYKEVNRILKNKAPEKKKITLIDILLLTYAAVPWIIMIVGILCLIWTFYYIFSS